MTSKKLSKWEGAGLPHSHAKRCADVEHMHLSDYGGGGVFCVMYRCTFFPTDDTKLIEGRVLCLGCAGAR